MRKIGIFFDLDGTLVDSLLDIVGVLNRVRAHYQFAPLEPHVVKPFIGKGGEYLLTHCVPGVANPSELLNVYRAFYVETPCYGGKLYPKVLETLQVLRSFSNCIMGVVTNKPTRSAEKTLESYLPQFKFDVIAGPECVSSKKPDPAHLLEVIDKFNIFPSNCWMVGDDEVDYLCAKAAQTQFLGASYGFGRVRDCPAVQLGTFTDLLPYILPILEKSRV